MISVIFHDIFSRFPEGIEQTEDEGKVLSYEEFEMTSEYLKKNNNKILHFIRNSYS